MFKHEPPKVHGRLLVLSSCPCLKTLRLLTTDLITRTKFLNLEGQIICLFVGKSGGCCSRRSWWTPTLLILSLKIITLRTPLSQEKRQGGFFRRFFDHYEKKKKAQNQGWSKTRSHILTVKHTHHNISSYKFITANIRSSRYLAHNCDLHNSIFLQQVIRKNSWAENYTRNEWGF